MNKKSFRIEQLFGSKTRARLLGLFLQDAEKSYYVRELTRKIGAQLNSVRRELENLKDLGLIKEEKKTAEKSSKSLAENKKYYKADPNFILFNDKKISCCCTFRTNLAK